VAITLFRLIPKNPIAILEMNKFVKKENEGQSFNCNQHYQRLKAWLRRQIVHIKWEFRDASAGMSAIKKLFLTRRREVLFRALVFLEALTDLRKGGVIKNPKLQAVVQDYYERVSNPMSVSTEELVKVLQALEWVQFDADSELDFFKQANEIIRSPVEPAIPVAPTAPTMPTYMAQGLQSAVYGYAESVRQTAVPTAPTMPAHRDQDLQSAVCDSVANERSPSNIFHPSDGGGAGGGAGAKSCMQKITDSQLPVAKVVSDNECSLAWEESRPVAEPLLFQPINVDEASNLLEITRGMSFSEKVNFIQEECQARANELRSEVFYPMLFEEFDRAALKDEKALARFATVCKSELYNYLLAQEKKQGSNCEGLLEILKKCLDPANKKTYLPAAIFYSPTYIPVGFFDKLGRNPMITRGRLQLLNCMLERCEARLEEKLRPALTS
jgi:hypothetical protein